MKKLSSTIKAFLSFPWILLGLSAASPTASAAPFVESYTLVSSVRSGRTTFDYTYRPLVRVDSNSYRSATFVATSRNPATQVVKGSINLGDLDAGKVVLAPDTFTIRQDRLVPFDRAALDFSFSGTMVSKDSGASGLSVGKVAFLEQGGRPGHEVLLPIQGADPQAGQAMPVAVDIYGPAVSGATYRLLDSHGLPLASGPLSQNSDAPSTSPRYFAKVEVPNQPFKIEVSAVGQSASIFAWLSTLYTPTPTTLRIEPSTAILSKSQTIPVILRLASFGATPSGVHRAAAAAARFFAAPLGHGPLTWHPERR
jgi:hypothetical protein